MEELSMFVCFLLLIFLVVGIIFGCNYFSSTYQVKIWNERYGTHYTAMEFTMAYKTITKFIGPGEQSTNNINLKIDK